MGIGQVKQSRWYRLLGPHSKLHPGAHERRVFSCNPVEGEYYKKWHMERAPKILIVEDNEHNHKLYRDIFEKAGFNVTIFQNADGTFAEDVAELSPDIIAMDLMIGLNGRPAERDGFQAIEVLKADLRTHEIPIFVMTSFFAEEKVARAKELGAVDFISVPGQTFSRIPDYFLNYLKNPQKYRPIHSLF